MKVSLMRSSNFGWKCKRQKNNQTLLLRAPLVAIGAQKDWYLEQNCCMVFSPGDASAWLRLGYRMEK